MKCTNKDLKQTLNGVFSYLSVFPMNICANVFTSQWLVQEYRIFFCEGYIHPRKCAFIDCSAKQFMVVFCTIRSDVNITGTENY